jgi:predicted small integral membrane protein
MTVFIYVHCIVSILCIIFFVSLRIHDIRNNTSFYNDRTMTLNKVILTCLIPVLNFLLFGCIIYGMYRNIKFRGNTKQ